MEKDELLVKDALMAILSIETSQKFSAAPSKVRRREVIDLLDVNELRVEEALKCLKRLGYARYVLFGCVELTRQGRLRAFQNLTGT